MLGDTDFFIDLMRGEPRAVAKRRELDEKGIPLAATAMTLHELALGATLYVRPEEERARIHRVLRGIPVRSYDAQAASLGGELEGGLRLLKQIVDRADVMNGAVARLRKEPVLTRNLKDYTRIPGVTVETY